MRRFKDIAAKVGITAGGLSVIATLALIFLYLVAEVAPLFMPASVKSSTSMTTPAASPVLFSAIEEKGRVAVLLQDNGVARFIEIESGRILGEQTLVQGGIASVVNDDLASHRLALVGKDGRVLIVRHEYHVIHGEAGKSEIVPSWTFPLGDQPLSLLPGPLSAFAFRDAGSTVDLVAVGQDNTAVRKQYTRVESFLTGETELQELASVTLPTPSTAVDLAFISGDGHWLFLLEGGKQVEVMDLRESSADGMRHSVVPVLVEGATRITATTQLLGGISLLLGDDRGNVTQWFMALGADQQRKELTLIRRFEVASSPITVMQSEQRRKSFVAGTAAGEFAFWHTTAERENLTGSTGNAALEWLAISPRGNTLYAGNGERAHLYKVYNKHPELSFASLWQKVWYENYPEPAWIWQSSSASSDFEPKYSLMPLTFGTIKAAFYAMLVAVPLAIFGAIYTAYFMAPALRTKVKPAIELMGALPTVILGFLAGLWLAPIVEAYLPAVFLILVVTPLIVVLVSWWWSLLPIGFRTRVPDGWTPLLLIPFIVFSVWFCFQVSLPVENVFFDGNVRGWLEHRGIDFDQRNALIVGIAMGFTVIPIIYSIAEDAIFAVPKALSFGSLALGATPWQTMVRVVLPTASPGIFSALMIGLGRAVGETMIVLMAAGNTPIMDFNIFEGLRTLSANIAVEMPESEIGSSHFRLLFLSGLVLFVFTFVLNSTAEMVRQHLRAKYSSL